MSEGYSSKLLISILSPLLQNAVTASPDSELVTIEGVIINGKKQIRVINKCDHAPDNNALDKIGYSSKQNHEGIGLETVRTLLKLSRYGTLSHTVNKNIVTFTINLT